MALNRRHFLSLLGASAGAGAVGSLGLPKLPLLDVEPAQALGLPMRVSQAGETFTLPPLPYDYAALEPYIDAETMQFHHDKHHAAYVKNLNAAVDKHPQLKTMTAEELVSDINALPEDVRTTIRNNGGGHLNHSLFWEIMGPNGGGEPTGAIATAIQEAFGGFSAFQQAFNEAGANRFGSGWAWLVLRPNGRLEVTSTANQDSPLMDGNQPIMGNDVWEHAYYLKYRNRRDEYLNAWWNVVNWDAVNQRYEQAMTT
ncbi:MAG: superoxide dismutase [Synechococcales cyanobacterium C42_A2020_086]|jgi:Fe-Mn family superoxide dismutase|nr:superoxide dismutase [Synechococcales cyanobacterium C42_A2020_086]